MTPIPQKKIDAIISAVTAGEPVRRVLRKKKVAPWRFYGMLDADKDLADRYTLAKYAGLDRLAEEILDIADQSRIGEKRKTVVVEASETDAESGELRTVKLPAVEVTTGDMVERSKLMIDSRKWLLAKLAPKKYGERTVLAGDPDAPLAAPTIVIGGPPELDDAGGAGVVPELDGPKA